MSATLSRPFRLSVQMNGRTDPPHVREQFIRDNGIDTLTDLLHKAGYDQGDWVFKISGKFKGSGRTPPVQVRRLEQNGVHLWIKPRDNASAVKGSLVVMRPLEPQAVYLKLRDANSSDVALFKSPEDGTVAHVESSF